MSKNPDSAQSQMPIQRSSKQKDANNPAKVPQFPARVHNSNFVLYEQQLEAA